MRETIVGAAISAAIATAIIAPICWLVGSSGNLEAAKAAAPAKFESIGFQTISYQGYKWGMGGYGTNYGGAQAWYELRKIPDNGITYSGFIQQWGDEFHIYGPTAREALKP